MLSKFWHSLLLLALSSCHLNYKLLFNQLTTPHSISTSIYVFILFYHEHYLSTAEHFVPKSLFVPNYKSISVRLKIVSCFSSGCHLKKQNKQQQQLTNVCLLEL